MSYKRPSALASRPDSALFTSWMAGIGFALAAVPDRHADIEPTLVAASEVGMEGDFRVLGLLTTWIGIHHARIHAARLVTQLESHPSARMRAYWAAISFWLVKDRRLSRLQAGYEGPALPLLEVGNEFQLARRGEDPRFVGSALLVPAGALRDRHADVLTASALIRWHTGYRNRVLLGPTWRALLWTLLEQQPELSAAEAARQTRCAFATAWEVVQDFRLLADGEVQTIASDMLPESG
jgi:hypothetical protein